jgi:hypothetical protein
MVYTSSRIALFAVSVAVLDLVGLRNGWVLLLAALLLSGLLSFVLLSRQRDAMSAAVVQRTARARERLRARTEAEDDDDVQDDQDDQDQQDQP